MILLFFCILATNVISVTAQPFTASEMETMLQTIDSYFFLPNPTYRMEIRKFLRAAFHDCMGGCDGSISLDKTDNRGLESFVQVLTTAYTASVRPKAANYNIFKRMTRADFWVLCEERALAWGIKNGNTAFNFSGVTYVYGRPAATSENSDPNETALPNAAGGWAAMLETFKVGIPPLLEQDIVTLLGLHGSGTAEYNNSGFQGPWGPSADKNVVNNRFYANLLSYKLPQAEMIQVLASNSNFPVPATTNTTHTSPTPPTNLIEWVRPRSNTTTPLMMLPIDMQIYLNFTPNATGGEDSGEYFPQGNNQTLYDCTANNCPNKKYLPLADNAPLAFKFAKSNADYIDALIPAFLKLVSYTKDNITLTQFSPQWGCVDGVATCLGDIFFTGCSSQAIQC